VKHKLPPRRKIDELIAFLPRLTADGFAPVREWGGGEKQADGAYVMPWPVYDEMVLAPDALFPLGGYPDDEDHARALLAKLDQPKAFEDFIATTQFLRSKPGTSDRLGVMGFRYGGAIANRLAAALPDLAAAHGMVLQA
jgi:hypothetical protein